MLGDRPILAKRLPTEPVFPTRSQSVVEISNVARAKPRPLQASLDGMEPSAPMRNVPVHAAWSAPVDPLHALADWRAAGLDGVGINHQITRTYEAYGTRLQARLDPDFDPLNPTASRANANWFALASHPSAAAGDVIEVARDMRDIFAAKTAGKPGDVLREYAAAGEALIQAIREVDLKAFVDPRLLAISSERAIRLLEAAPGRGVREKLESFSATLENLCAEGNQAIFADIAASGATYQRFLVDHPGLTPERFLAAFRLPGSTPKAGALYTRALADVHAGRLPTQVEALLPAPFTGLDAVVVAFTLYEQARLTPDLATKNALIVMGNALILVREQRDLGGPVMNPGRILEGEVDRPSLMKLITPTIRISAGGDAWRFSEYARDNLPKHGKDPLVPRSTEYNWADLQTRLDAIWDFSRHIDAPENRGKIWNLPSGKAIEVS